MNNLRQVREHTTEAEIGREGFSADFEALMEKYHFKAFIFSASDEVIPCPDIEFFNTCKGNHHGTIMMKGIKRKYLPGHLEQFIEGVIDEWDEKKTKTEELETSNIDVTKINWSGKKKNGIAAFSISADELRDKKLHTGTTAACPNCHAQHLVEYGNDPKTKEPVKMAGFVTCPIDKEAYLVVIGGRLL